MPQVYGKACQRGFCDILADRARRFGTLSAPRTAIVSGLSVEDPVPSDSSVHRPTDPATCPNCGAQVTQAYCGSCGQEADIHGQTWREYLVDISYDFLSVDGKIWKGFRDLVVWPGTLTLDYIEGRRVSRPVPSRLFLVMTVLVFGVVPLIYGWFGADSVYADSIGLQLLDHIVPILNGLGYNVALTPEVRAALVENASLGALLSVVPLCGALVVMRTPKGAPFNVHVAHAFHLTAATMILLLVGQLAQWSFLPILVGTVWYFRLAYRTQDRTERRRVWRLALFLVLGWLVAALWLWAGVGLFSSDVNASGFEITVTDTIGTIMVAPLLIMLAVTVIILAFGVDILYVARSLMVVGALPMRAALLRAFVVVLVMLIARMGLVVMALLLS